MKFKQNELKKKHKIMKRKLKKYNIKNKDNSSNLKRKYPYKNEISDDEMSKSTKKEKFKKK